MTNLEKYAEKIKEMISSGVETDCAISNMRGKGVRECNENNVACVDCALDNITWLLQEYNNGAGCKWYREIKGENKYYVCLKEGQVLSAGDEDVNCGFWEKK